MQKEELRQQSLSAKHQEQTQLKLEYGFHAKELVPLSKLPYFSRPQFLLLSMGMMVITLVEVRNDHT